MLLERGAFVPEMFDLSTGVVTQVLKAFVDEKMRLAIVGDLYDCYQSSMRDHLQPEQPGQLLGDRGRGPGLAEQEVSFPPNA